MIAAILFVLATAHPWALIALGALIGVKLSVIVWVLSPALSGRSGIPASRSEGVFTSVEAGSSIREPDYYVDPPSTRHG